ncbi:multicopper oxidase domain-containing protein [Hirsutella rhossiliensis]|uniref:Multicopper oxidase domain-containing protein n=1 Tax=Hirsutella rhossiliensis TaxID=111463 RepID=A0A9P8MRP1_9HYPO|nr:multicopper oxidase domain-containing protein [Hirsutella rhossiliensis]KAH0960167.1 multicopper oxidase domain-containing protein [Hirsutella rhossiliensis]
MEKHHRARPGHGRAHLDASLEAATATAGPLRRRRRPLIAVLSAALFCATATVLYLASFYALRAPTTPNGQYDASDRAHVPSGGAGADDGFILHPENHIRREARAIHLAWNVTKATRSPDGVSKSVYLINGQFPGPLVEARSGDELVVNVRNSIDGDHGEGISVHWHGLLMKGANEMDGAVGLTQCAIGPAEDFTYRFRIHEQQSGTFWYHAHAGVQRADGLFGGLVIHKPVSAHEKHGSDLSTYQYEAEQLLLVGDWYHRPAGAVLDWFMDPNHYAYEPAPDSMLINGQGFYDCSMAVKARPVNCSAVEKPAVRLAGSDRVRLRIVNTGITSGLTLSLTHGTMRLIAVDGGGPVSASTPAAAAIGVLYPGERMDLVVDRRIPMAASSAHVAHRVDGDPPRLRIALDKENMGLKNFALTRKQSFPLVWKAGKGGAASTHRRHGPEAGVPHLALGDASGPPLDPALAGLIEHPHETAVLYTTMLVRAANHNRPVGTVNHTSWAVSDPKSQPLLSLDREQWSSAIPQPTWLELVINNFDDKGHPFHMHGYSFFVVASRQAQMGQAIGYNPLDPAAAAQAPPVNTANPLRKDTVYVPPQGHVVLRLPLDNDGLWLLHCHVLWHQAAGMGIVLQVGEIAAGARQRASALCAS